MCGLATSHSRRMCPGPLLPISHTPASVAPSAARIVRGSPTSLLNEASLATTRNRSASTAAVRSFVHVLPVDPVMPTTYAESADRSPRARSSSAAPGSRTATTGPSIDPAATWSALTIAAAAPLASASATNACPSERSPGSPTNRLPGEACRLSMETPRTVTEAAPGGRTSPPTERATSASVSSLIRHPSSKTGERGPAAPLGPRSDRRTGWFGP